MNLPRLAWFRPRRVLELSSAVLVLGSLSLTFAGCGEEGGAATPPIDYTALLRDLSEKVAVPTHQAAATEADALLVTLRTLESAPSAESLAAAQVAWRKARAAYRRLDAFTFGPMTQTAIDIRIDASPADHGGIESTINGQEAIDVGMVGRLGGKKKGFLALEHLLFRDKDGGSAVLAGFEPNGRRGQLARAVGEEIAASTHQLADAWDPAKGGYGAEISNAGNGGVYSTQRAALDDLVGGGAFALELVVGVRLAMPLGRKTSGNPEPEQDPTLASDSAVADMLASMQGISALYKEAGFSSLIRAQEPNLDDKALAELGDCQSKLGAIPAPFGASVTGQNATVQAAFEACKALKLTWNTDITSTLGATLRPLDTDGD